MSRSGHILPVLFVMVCFCCPAGIWAQTRKTPEKPQSQKANTIIIDHFGNFIEDKTGPESVKWISKGLQLRIDSTNIYADSAVIFADTRVYAYGDVVIQQGDSMHIFADTLVYSRETDIADLIGEVALEQGTKQLWTTDLRYHLTERFGEYNQGGVLVDESLQVSSKQGRYYAATEEVHFRDSVIVLHPRFNLAADSMKYLAPISQVVFTGPTNIYTSSAKIYCESGYYDLHTEIAEFNRKAQYAGENKKATADTIRYLSLPGEVNMLGNVNVQELDRRFRGTSLRYLEKTGETWLFGDPARYSDSIRTLISPEIFYNEKSKQVSTKGSSIIRDGDLSMKAEHFEFNQETGLGMASGNVEWVDTVQNIGIRSDIVDYDKKSSYILAHGSTRPVFFTLIESDTLFIAADTLNMWSQADTLGAGDTVRMIRAYHDVRLYKSNMQGLADSIVFHGRDSIFSLFGSPVLWSDTTQFIADSITIGLRNEQIHTITLTRKAVIISEIFQTYYDQIKGKTIVAQFEQNDIRDMWVNGNAESIYYTRDDNSAFIGVNKTICSKMFFTFEEGQIKLLKYYGDNTSSMKPMGEVSHDAMRLEGFIWRAEERPLNVKDLVK